MTTEDEREEITERMKGTITDGLKGKVETIERHGAYLLNALSNDLYTDFAQASKEYISNSVDAKAKEIRIRWQHPEYETLVISDDGNGMSKDELFGALDVMVSSKRGEYDPDYPMIGRFGVGLYAGALLCDTIHITSKTRESKKVNTVRIPIARWLEAAMNPELELSQVTHYVHDMDDATDEQQGKSFTIVVFENLKPRVVDMLKKDKAKKFIEELSRILPVGFDPGLKLSTTSLPDAKKQRWNFFSWINPLLDGSTYGQRPQCQYNNARVYFNGKQIFRPAPVKDSISDVHQPITAFYIDKDGKKEIAGVGWALARGPRKITPRKSDRTSEKFGTYSRTIFRGVQVRLNNVGIFMHATTYAKVGVKTQSQPAGNWWGEIYLAHDDLKLTLTRTEFVKNDAWHQLEEQIHDWLQQLLINVENARKRERARVKKEDKEKKAKAEPEVEEGENEVVTESQEDEDFESLIEVTLDDVEELDTSWIEELQERFVLTNREAHLLEEFQLIARDLKSSVRMEKEVIPRIVKILEEYPIGERDEELEKIIKSTPPEA